MQQDKMYIEVTQELINILRDSKEFFRIQIVKEYVDGMRNESIMNGLQYKIGFIEGLLERIKEFKTKANETNSYH